MTQSSVDNKVNDLHYELKFENCVKDKITLLSEALLFFLKQKYVLFSETYFFRIPKNLITLAFLFLPKQILKNIGMQRQKPQMLQW